MVGRQCEDRGVFGHKRHQARLGSWPIGNVDLTIPVGESRILPRQLYRPKRYESCCGFFGP